MFHGSLCPSVCWWYFSPKYDRSKVQHCSLIKILPSNTGKMIYVRIRGSNQTTNLHGRIAETHWKMWQSSLFLDLQLSYFESKQDQSGSFEFENAGWCYCWLLTRLSSFNLRTTWLSVLQPVPPLLLGYLNIYFCQNEFLFVFSVPWNIRQSYCLKRQSGQISELIKLKEHI